MSAQKIVQQIGNMQQKKLRVIEKKQDQELPNHQTAADELRKGEIVREIKSKAAVMLIEAAQSLECKNFHKAKLLYIDIAEMCFKIADPDEQVVGWLKISYRFIALIYISEKDNFKEGPKDISSSQLQEQINLDFNKISSQFTIENLKEDTRIDQDILQYISKINSILFGDQNILNNHSLMVMFCSYWLPFLILFGALIMSFLLLIRKDIVVFGQSLISEYLPQIVLGICSSIPIFVVFLKTQDQRTNQFFQRRLGECIDVINQHAKSREKNVEFILLNQGRRIKVKISKKADKFRQLQFLAQNVTPDYLINHNSTGTREP